MKLYVSNIPFDVTEPQLKEFFEQVGAVTKATLIYDKVTNRPRGFGFVEMKNGQEAIEQLNGVELLGRDIKVEEARERPRDSGNDRQRQNNRY